LLYTPKLLAKSSIFVIGTGEIANLLLKLICKTDVGKLYIGSHNYERAEEMAEIYNAQPIHLASAKKILSKIDIIIGGTVATATPDATKNIIHASDIEQLVPGKKLLMIDLGVPRNFDPAIKQLSNVTLYDLDDIKLSVHQNLEKRKEEIPKARAIIEEETTAFINWLGTQQVTPLISSIWQQLEELKEEELKWVLPKLGDLNEKQTKIVERLIHRIIRKVSKNPIEQLKHYAQQNEEKLTPIEAFKKVFFKE